MKKTIIFVAIALVLVNLNLVYAANSLSVEKLVENQDIKVGDDVKILLKFTNPFGQELPIKIVDKNVFGNNGIDIQCLEYTLPKDKEAVIAYEPIKPFSAGKYNLSPAEITYTNPQTGSEETIKSAHLEIEVKESGAQQGQAKGITTIYRCNGMNMQSISYSSSGSSFNIQIGGSNIPQQFNQGSQQQGSPQDRVQNNQLNQNTNILKQQMEQQVQQQKQAEQEFQKNLAQNKEFQEKHQELLNSGYNLTNASFNVISNSTGSFELFYQKPDGKNATLKGDMENGTIKNLMSLTDEDKQKILDLLYQNKEFQRYDKQLRGNGFNQTKPLFNQITQNYTKITIPYKKNEKENEIKADYLNGIIQNVQLENNENNDRINLWWFLLIPILGLVGWFVYITHFKKIKSPVQKPALERKVEDSIDYKKEAKKMLREAKDLFDNKKEKDAYEKVSQAIRFYFSYALGIKKEITNAELLKKLEKEEAKNYSEIQRCLHRCSMVEFAKDKPNKKDFDEIIQIGEKMIM